MTRFLLEHFVSPEREREREGGGGGVQFWANRWFYLVSLDQQNRRSKWSLSSFVLSSFYLLIILSTQLRIITQGRTKLKIRSVESLIIGKQQLLGDLHILIVGPALRRLPSRVKAKRRCFIYDKACAKHKSTCKTPLCCYVAMLDAIISGFETYAVFIYCRQQLLQ